MEKEIKELNPVEFWNKVFDSQTKDENDYQLRVFRLLSKIESECDSLGISRKELAKKIGTSQSNLTQVWRGDKSLNFKTLAKIKQTLNISFTDIDSTKLLK